MKRMWLALGAAIALTGLVSASAFAQRSLVRGSSTMSSGGAMGTATGAVGVSRAATVGGTLSGTAVRGTLSGTAAVGRYGSYAGIHGDPFLRARRGPATAIAAMRVPIAGRGGQSSCDWAVLARAHPCVSFGRVSIAVAQPMVVIVPAMHVVHVETAVAGAKPAVAPRAAEACAILTVLHPGHRGSWYRIQLPMAGARTLDELRRVLEARIEEGEDFRVRDAAGLEVDIPAAAELDRVIVTRCRQ